MKNVLWIVVFLLGAATGIAGIFIARPPCMVQAQTTQGVMISVSNDTGMELKNVEVHYSGGSVYTERLAPGASFSNLVSPTSEAALEIAYADQSGGEICEETSVSLNPEQSGDFQVSLQPDGKMTVGGAPAVESK